MIPQLEHFTKATARHLHYRVGHLRGGNFSLGEGGGRYPSFPHPHGVKSSAQQLHNMWAHAQVV